MRIGVREYSGICLCAAIVVALVAMTVRAADPPFAAGILRRDGVIIPFAVFDGKSWSNHWPKPSLDLTVPTDVGSVPTKWWGDAGAQREWQLWIGTAEPQTVKVVQPDWVDAYCVRQIGLHTDYRPLQLPPPPTEQPYPKDGLALAPPRAIERTAVVPPTSPEANSMLVELKEAFNRAERQPAGKVAHPVSKEVRENQDPKIEAVYSHGSEPRVFYVEATRE